jgi:hypothetical protein
MCSLQDQLRSESVAMASFTRTELKLSSFSCRQYLEKKPYPISIGYICLCYSLLITIHV